jgi:putative transposase
MTASAKGTAEAPGRKVRQKKARLNRAILDQGWSLFSRLLGYKLADRGGRLIEVPAAYTS